MALIEHPEPESLAESPEAPDETIPLSRPALNGQEQHYVQEALQAGDLAGDGRFTRLCQDWLERRTGAGSALLTHSCTGALELAALALDLGPGDEVVMPSFTAVGTATSVVRSAATPVFADIDPVTLGLDPAAVEDAITDRTRAIVAVHYAGVGCGVRQLRALADRAGIVLIEDAAQGLLAEEGGVPLGATGQFGAFSFHATKNVTSGHGGALLVNDPAMIERVRTIWDRGTDRAGFERGEVDAYGWQDIGACFQPPETTAAILWAQFQSADDFTRRRRTIWRRYHEAFAQLEETGAALRPRDPDGHRHNAHIFYLLMPDRSTRDRALRDLGRRGIGAAFHFTPLHQSAAGRRFGRTTGALPVTERVADTILRLPLYPDLDERAQDRVIEAVRDVLGR